MIKAILNWLWPRPPEVPTVLTELITYESRHDDSCPRSLGEGEQFREPGPILYRGGLISRRLVWRDRESRTLPNT